LHHAAGLGAQGGSVLSLTDRRQNNLRRILDIFFHLLQTAHQVGLVGCAVEPA
jgi:DNA-binding MurR/RpiR family transcriptional regulator